jgi:hypothetical protein
MATELGTVDSVLCLSGGNPQIVYTTNILESLNMSLRKSLKTRGAFPSEEAALKMMYLDITECDWEMGTAAEMEGSLEWLYHAVGRSHPAGGARVKIPLLRPEDLPYSRLRAAVKAPDELAALGLDSGPHRPAGSNDQGEGELRTILPNRRIARIDTSTKSRTLASCSGMRRAPKPRRQFCSLIANELTWIVSRNRAV